MTVAPPAIVAPTLALPLADAMPIGTPAAARAGGGSDAGTGTGAGTGNGSGIGPGTGGIVVTRADWAVKPTNEVLRRYWPRGPDRKPLSGWSAVVCRVRLSTRIHGCRVLSETPVGSGFGAATLAAAPTFRVRPPTRNGKPVDEAWVLVPILWTVQGQTSSAKPAAPAVPPSAPVSPPPAPGTAPPH